MAHLRPFSLICVFSIYRCCFYITWAPIDSYMHIICVHRSLYLLLFMYIIHTDFHHLSIFLAESSFFTNEEKTCSFYHMAIWGRFPIPSGNQTWRAGKSSIWFNDFPIKKRRTSINMDVQRSPNKATLFVTIYIYIYWMLLGNPNWPLYLYKSSLTQ